MTLILINIIANTECQQIQHNADTGHIDQFGESTVKHIFPYVSEFTTNQNERITYV